MWWLDAARYSDTDGFQSDATRTNWPWRDYIVESFNANKPFDQFTLEQFAGDLLPNATPEQKIATCFHRNHMTNGEGGRDKEESRIDYVIDRVNTTYAVWMGTTMACAQCHTHKYDPITITDGHVTVPTTPGLGFELDRQFLDAVTTSRIAIDDRGTVVAL